jgi:hypothetical protein
LLIVIRKSPLSAVPSFFFLLQGPKGAVLVIHLAPNLSDHGLNNTRDEFTIIGAPVFEPVYIVPANCTLGHNVGGVVPLDVAPLKSPLALHLGSEVEGDVAADPFDREVLAWLVPNCSSHTGVKVCVIALHLPCGSIEFVSNEVHDGLTIGHQARRRCCGLQHMEGRRELGPEYSLRVRGHGAVEVPRVVSGIVDPP